MSESPSGSDSEEESVAASEVCSSRGGAGSGEEDPADSPLEYEPGTFDTLFERLLATKSPASRVGVLDDLAKLLRAQDLGDELFSSYETYLSGLMRLARKVDVDYDATCRVIQLLAFSRLEDWDSLMAEADGFFLQEAQRSTNDGALASSILTFTYCLVFGSSDDSRAQDFFEKLLARLKAKMGPAGTQAALRALLVLPVFFSFPYGFQAAFTQVIPLMNAPQVEVRTAAASLLLSLFIRQSRRMDHGDSQRMEDISNHYPQLLDSLQRVSRETGNKRNKALKKAVLSFLTYLRKDLVFTEVVRLGSMTISLESSDDETRYDFYRALLGPYAIVQIQRNPSLQSQFSVSTDSSLVVDKSLRGDQKAAQMKQLKDRKRDTKKTRAKARDFKAVPL